MIYTPTTPYCGPYASSKTKTRVPTPLLETSPEKKPLNMRKLAGKR
ncbi:hypothetical protein HanXRQr2_Chr15g0673941 [Helianthus annuus]|uniref:Uncharacterized protein n=1 Tax=Helianthus annuus TaxID=4232 RepID=A0A9K3DWI2_HELAN|nr:hypothetical protein HanXRQr2_Chr15g0673941 [Helianthus annuus]KAJ0829703.1 hypothetical protein HanPSC8_Chr15g0646791 [Helianthus annuus]